MVKRSLAFRLRATRAQVARAKPVQRRVESAVALERPPTGDRVVGSVWGVAVVRDEADIVAATCEHLLEQGLAGLIVLDHRSADETPQILADLQRRHTGRIFTGRLDLDEFHQGRAQSYLAHLALAAGADWVIPFDADEWWFAPGLPLADYLARQRASVVRCAMYDVRPVAGALEFRVGDPAMAATSAGPRTKVAFRADGWVWVFEGNHEVDLPAERTGGLSMLHFACRSLDQATHRARSGARAVAAAAGELDDGVAEHWHRAAELDDASLTAHWQAFVQGQQSVFGPAAALIEIEDYPAWTSFDPAHLLARW